MTLFSRRPKKNDPSAPGASESALPLEPDTEQTAPAVPEVPITVTAYGTPAVVTAAPSVASAPAASTRPRQAVPGIDDNRLVLDALAALGPEPTPQQTFEVARQLLQGRMYLRVRGEARELLATGQDLPMATVTIGDTPYLLAFSGGAALQAAVRADGDTATSAIAVGVPALLHQVVDGPLAGLAIDLPSKPAGIVLPRALIEKIVAHLDEGLAVKSVLTGVRSPQSVAALVAALQSAPLWIAGRRKDDSTIGIVQARLSDGARVLEVFSHPLELHVLDRGDRPVRITAQQLAAALNGEPELDGVIVNPRGPWLRLSRDDLAPLLAHA
ncbi:MAG: SseB family protein [Microbacterium sp.]